MSKTNSVTNSRDILSSISWLFVDRIGRALWFYFLELLAIFDGFLTQSRVFRGGADLSDFRELSFCGPCINLKKGYYVLWMYCTYIKLK